MISSVECLTNKIYETCKTFGNIFKLVNYPHRIARYIS